MDTPSTEKDGGPAFPEPGLSGLPNDQFIYGRSGMYLRDWFAGQALAYPLGEPGTTAERRAKLAYQIADAMLAARAQGGAS